MTSSTPKTEYAHVPKPPVVVILGHVDHGKTSLLDSIRKSHVAQKESGGITQHIGAYQVTYQGKPITFIDTPGHEAFSAMRSRGAGVADLALLVVAADDGIMPQTKEALMYIQKSGMPYIVVMNKIDAPYADPQKAKNQLAQENVLLEGMGGKIPVVETSAETGQGIDDLLDMINLVWEVEDITARSEGPAEGVVVESFLDPHRGPSATLLINKGVLMLHDIVAMSSAWGKVRILEDFSGKTITEAGPSVPTLMLGLNDVPQVGEKFVVVSSMSEAEDRVSQKQRKESNGELIDVEEGQKVLNIIIKADSRGTLEAVREILRPISNDNVLIRVLDEGVGSINDSDVKLAIASKSIIVGFRVGSVASARKLAEQRGIPTRTFDIIYELVQNVREIASGLVEEEIVEAYKGRLRVLAIFRTERSRMIIGGRVTDGDITRGMLVHVMRGDELIGEGKIGQIKVQDRVIEHAPKGEECGLLFEGTTRIAEGDTLELFVREKKTPTSSHDK